MRTPYHVAIAVLVVSSTVAGCGAGTSRKARTAHDSPARDATATSAAPATAISAPTNKREVAARIGRDAVDRGFVEHWAALAFHGQVGAPEPPEYRGCIKQLASEGQETTAEQLKRACQRKYDQIQYKALAWLIYSRWVIGAAREAGLGISEEQLRRETAVGGTDGEAVKRTLASTGETISDFRLNLLRNKLAARLLRKLEGLMPHVTSVRLAGYYRRHKSSFAIPERRDLYIVRLSSLAKASKAKRELEHGASFAKIVSSTSLMQNEEAHDGLIRGLEARNWPEQPLSREVFHAPLKTLQGPVRISLGYYVFEVVGRTPPQQKSFADSRPEVAERLHQRLQEQAFARYGAELRREWVARTKCPPSALRSMCRRVRSSPAGAQDALSSDGL